MSLDSLLKMRELEIESEENSPVEDSSDEDADSCDNQEIERLFENCKLVAEKSVAPNKYILQISATLESTPNVAVALSDHSCEVFRLSNDQFAKLPVSIKHPDVISEIKFSTENSNLIYTGSNDGSIKLWDLRAPKTSSLHFKDTTATDNFKQITCFDVSPNNFLVAAGTNLFEGDTFILFWDARKSTLLGGYWESHTDDITQVKFHSNDSNRLASGSVDGLINLYDLSQTNEDDALIDSLNTESSIEKLTWIQQNSKDVISCVTHTAEIQLWSPEDAQPYLHLHRNELADHIKRKSKEYIYVTDVHGAFNKIVALTGSNYQDGQCFRGLCVDGKTVKPSLGFSQNKQRVRTSFLNPNLNLLLTGGEKGFLDAWRATLR